MKINKPLFLTILIIILSSSFVSSGINSTPGLDVDFMNYYNLDSDTLDSVGSDDATATNIVSASSCKIGDCYSWNGENNRLVIPNTAYMDEVFGGSHYTVNFWINTTDIGADIFSKSEGTFVKWTEVLFSGGNLYYYIDDAANRRGTSPAVTGVNDGEWHMVTMRRYSGGFSLSIDSVEVATNTESLGDATNTKDIYFGDNNYLQGLIGRIDEIGFWNRSLTDTEINQLHNSSNGCNPVVSNYCEPTATTTTTTTSTTTSTTTTTTLLCNDGEDCIIDCSTIDDINQTANSFEKTIYFINSGFIKINTFLNYSKYRFHDCKPRFKLK